MTTVYAWQVVDCTDYEYTRVLGTYKTEAEATAERERLAKIMKFRGTNVDDLTVTGFLLPEFRCEVEELVPGEMFDSTFDSAFRKIESMLDMHYIGHSWHSHQDLEVDEFRYSADKRNRSFTRLVNILEYARVRLQNSCERRGITRNMYERDDIRQQRNLDEERAWRAQMEAELEAEKPKRTLKDMLDGLLKK
jgi:hypothetical protein